MERIRLLDKDFEIYLPERDIQRRVKKLGKQLSEDYKSKNLLLVAVLNGGFMFAADFIRSLNIPASIHFMQVASYGDEMQSGGKIDLIKDLHISIKDQHVVLLEDIVDSGLTSQFLARHLRQQQPASLRLLTLLFKPHAFEAEIKPDYIGFEIPPEFVVGYGMDYAQQGRGLKAIYRLSDS